jgi:hypothetical protein
MNEAPEPPALPLADGGIEIGGDAAQEPKISLSSEWSLAGFTFLLAVLFALLAAGVSGTRQISSFVYAVVAAVAALLSLVHLGKPARAWRAILNLRRSPVSREVLGFGGLATFGILYLAWPEGDAAGWIGWLGLGLGLLALTSADRVYRPVYHRGNPALHSGGVLLTGLYLAGLLAGIPWLAAPVGAFKLYRYVTRHLAGVPATERSKWRAPGAAARIGLGFLVPGLAWVWTGIPLPTWALGAALFGEAVDRAEFYSGLEIVSPARQLRQDLEARLAGYEAGPAIRSMASASSSYAVGSTSRNGAAT